jgi:hypothetical protein
MKAPLAAIIATCNILQDEIVEPKLKGLLTPI